MWIILIIVKYYYNNFNKQPCALAWLIVSSVKSGIIRLKMLILSVYPVALCSNFRAGTI